MSGAVYFNRDIYSDSIDLSTIQLASEMVETSNRMIGGDALSKFRVKDLNGCKDTANKLLGFISGRAAADGQLVYINFFDWCGEASEIERGILTLLAEKTQGLHELHI